MESNSNANSVDSSPRYSAIEYDIISPPWETKNYRAKFMCSYGGKILSRHHDNSLRYVGGETKILAVDPSIKLSAMITKLSSLFRGGSNAISLKYQLPGEDLDALISVTDDEDLELMMYEHHRLRFQSRPTRMRIFLFPLTWSSFVLPRGAPEIVKERPVFPTPPPPPSWTVGLPPPSDYLAGRDGGGGFEVGTPVHACFAMPKGMVMGSPALDRMRG